MLKEIQLWSLLMRITTHRQKELMATVVSNWYETADWTDEDDIDMTGFTLQNTALENAMGIMLIYVWTF